jgi:hypothetical protein
MHDKTQGFPKVLGESELLNFLKKSFYEFMPSGNLQDEQKKAVEAQREKAKAEIDRDFNITCEKLVSLAFSSEQLDCALDNAFQQYKTHYLAVNLGHIVTKKQRELLNNAHESFLEVGVTVEINSIDIPDPSKDEIMMDVTIYSGAKKEPLIGFIKANKITPDKKADEMLKKWISSDALVGNMAEEKEVLEKILGTNFYGITEEKSPSVNYNYGPETGFIWRTYSATLYVATKLDTSLYPFDNSLIVLSVHNTSEYDPSEALFWPDKSNEASFMLKEGATPRGFQIGAKSRTLQAVTHKVAKDQFAGGELLFGFELKRKPDSAFWRTFVPSLVVVTLALLASALAIFFKEHIDSVMTQLLPAVLIACVALQWTAAQVIPPNSGRTRMDEYFVFLYFHILFLYLSLALFSVTNKGCKATLLAAVVVLILCLLRFLSPLVCKPKDHKIPG